MERAAVASRWTWLQAQVSDLEYRIRQQNDIYRQIRASKGAVTLGDMVVADDRGLGASTPQQQVKLEEKLTGIDRKHLSPAELSALLNNVSQQSSHLTQQLGNTYSPELGTAITAAVANAANSPKTPSTPNGFVDPNSSIAGGPSTSQVAHGTDSRDAKQPCLESSGADLSTSLSPDVTCQAARCRPVKSYRKRKLLRAAGLHQINRKAARLSTVKCHCYPPTVPCTMCGGRYNNVMAVDPDIMPLPERVSLLDPSYHPVLSFSQGKRQHLLIKVVKGKGKSQ